MSRRVLFEEGQEYQLGGGFGSWALSFERGIRRGDVRMIDGVLMYAYTVYREGWFGVRRVNWCPVDRKLCHDSAGLRSFTNGGRVQTSGDEGGQE